MDASESDLTCCGLSVLIDGSCQHRSYHPRQITPEMVEIASYALRTCRCPDSPRGSISVLCPAHGSTEAKVRAVLEAVL